MVRPASLMFLLALAAPSLSGCCKSCYPSRYCCPPSPVVAQAPPCCSPSARYGPSYMYQPAYPPAAPSAALYPPGPPPAVINPNPNGINPNPNGINPNPNGPWQPMPNKPIVKENPPKDNGVKVLPPINPPENKVPDFSADVPNYKLFMQKVAVGTRPLKDGYAWLKAQGYKTVLYLRGPGEEDGEIRTAVEANGMKYLALDVDPEKLDKNLVKDFSGIVNDSASYPLFVVARKPMTNGAMFYLHLRGTQQEKEADARKVAEALGLTDNAEDAEWWKAIDLYLKP